ncbi:MAG TPA: OmpH family outer membrane protein [Dongiaceae bacterium]|nr:OmpH family outer membrane protein [Dongiaceae bacterium]
MRYFSKLTSAIVVALAIGIGSLSVVHSAQAQQAAGAVIIAVIDRQEIMSLSSAGKGLQAAGSQRAKQLQDDIQKRQDALGKQRQTLEQQKATLTPQDYQNKLVDLGRQSDQLRLDFQTKKRAFDTSAQQALEQIQNQTFAIVKQIAAQRNISLVLYKDMVAWGPGAVDITPDVVAQLNQKLPSVKF